MGQERAVDGQQLVARRRTAGQQRLAEVGGGVDFQQQVWQALRAIPFGETRSYQQVAEAIGKPKAVRAVASACAANRLAILVPCHRVVGADGTLTGYAGGVERKAWLLEHERPGLF